MRVSVSRGYTLRFALSIAELASKQIVIPAGEDLPVRDFNEGKDKYVDWDDKAGKGKGIIRIYKREDRTDDPVILTEGEDFYIKDGKAYYYNNVRAILEAQDCNVDFKQDKGKGNSRIEIASLLGMPLRTLYEGTDYTIGNDGKAHFVGDGTLPPGAENPLRCRTDRTVCRLQPKHNNLCRHRPRNILFGRWKRIRYRVNSIRPQVAVTHTGE